MRVLLLGLAGDERLCRCLAEGGMEVTAFRARRVDLGDFGHLVQAPPDSDTPYRSRSGPVWPIRPYPYSRWTGGLARTIRLANPRVALYVGEPSELAAAQSLSLVRRLAPEARLGVYVFENIPRQWRGRLRWLRGRAERKVLADLDFATCASHGAVDRLVALGLPEERCRVVYPQVDARLFRPVASSAVRRRLGLQEAVVTGYVGRIVWEKGLDVLLDALAGLPEQYRLLLVGSGDYLRTLQARIEALGMRDRVVQVASVPSRQVPEYLCAMDMLVLPSRSISTWQEQYGRVLAEAMLCRVPVIGSDCGAMPEVIGPAGLVVPQEDPKALAEAILRVGQDPQLRKALARKGLERAEQCFAHTYEDEMPRWLYHVADMPLRRHAGSSDNHEASR